MNESLITIQPERQQMIAATCDDELVDAWIKRLPSEATKASYAKIAADFRDAVGVSVRALKLEHLLDYKEHLATVINGRTGKPYSAATQGTHLKAVKSLLSFAHKSGYAPYNVGTMVKVANPEEKRAERILTEEEVLIS